MKMRLPLWVYWTLAGLAITAAGVFTFMLDSSELAPGEAPRLYFTIWGGPLTLLIAASLVTWLDRTNRG